jgi:pimeloyl-ACP methyl ester carboxylesterase
MPEAAGPITQAIFTTQFGQKLLKMIGEKKPAVFLKQIFQAEGYFTREQIKKHIDYALNSPAALNFMYGFMNTMNPYTPRKKGTENDMAQALTFTHLPLENIHCPSMILHGTLDADVKFYDGVYAYEHIPDCDRYWIEEGSHLGFWLSPNAQQAQNAAREFLDKHSP